METNAPDARESTAIPAPLAGADRTGYDALRDGAALLLHPARHWSRFSGPKAAEVLNGLVTNDVVALATGSGQYAAALSPKGKMLTDLVILRTEPESFLAGASATGGAAWMAMVRKYVNPRLAQFRDESAEHVVLGVYGPRAMRHLARLGGASGHASMLTDALEEALGAWPAWRHALWNTPATAARLVRVPELGEVPGFELLVNADALDAVRSRLEGTGVVSCTDAAFAVARVEAGRPLWGEDMDDTTIPQEANLDEMDAISFSKGCYTGQETVARVHFRGHVNRHLRGLRLDGPVAPHATLVDGAGKIVGEVRRSVVSPSLGAIATAMVRKEVQPGSQLSVTTAQGFTRSGIVVTLPFAAP